MSPKVLIIGLDGATFTILNPFMEQGIMPTLKNIADHGIAAELQSTIPPLTGPAWTTFMTGLNPGKHGIYDFLVRDEKTGKGIPINARLRHGKPFWEYLSDAGKTVLVLNVPVTYPPAPVNGAIVSGFLTPSGKRDFIEPRHILDEIEEKFGHYPLFIKMPLSAGGLSDQNITAFLDELNAILEYKCNVAHFLYDRYKSDLLMLHLWGVDRIQHELWHLIDEGHSNFNKSKRERFYKRIVAYYSKVDREIARLIEHTGDDTNVFVVSDHGFGPSQWMIDLNTWLLKNGFIRIKKTFSSQVKYALWKMGITYELFYRLFLKAALRLKWKSYVVDPVTGLRSIAHENTGVLLGTNDIDWAQTKAFAKYSSGIYVNRTEIFSHGSVDSDEETASIISSIVEGLKQLRNPQTGELIDGKIFLRQEVFHGPFARYCPDITYLPWDKKYLSGSFMGFGSNKTILDSVSLPGWHTMMGVFMARGPLIQRKKPLQGVTLTDMAPTLLYLMGQKIPRQMDGRVIKEMFADTFVEKNPVQYTDVPQQEKEPTSLAEEDQRELTERLKGLGYL